ncbi:glycosyltransferase family A protein [Francisella philomiragia]|nr:glycosyltransferase family A protein [Francisella philomiragia]MBK2252127.1 glycosyltransferase family 2 protein [Francisella philomiragia]MBK2267565.1 glycosyltransferase family 2 protein [Francisella philomiragia]MBK2279021.1 glycosyltransferase family 2 protein [Francisella philomiragia]MBK2286739.1 glycosyltransferase family 2 protein [Francisella philomiragia]MBK2288853.1 glycosyltransferase family 2 protein [Francisella philomiragia]
MLRYNIINLLSKKKGISGEWDKKIVVSLTTYSKRINLVYIAIESIMNQTLQADKIVLWISSQDLENGEVPWRLEKLKRRGLDIYIIDENIKSYKKLIYSIEKFTDSVIITCDDDTLYPRYFIEEIYKKHLLYPKAIIGYRCSYMLRDSSNQLCPYKEWANKQVKTPSFNLFPTGVGGILYPNGSLNKKISNKELFLQLAPTGDDIWFKAMGLLNNTKTISVFDRFIEFPSILSTNDDALWHENIGNNKNDEQLKNVFDYFNLYNYIRED